MLSPSHPDTRHLVVLTRQGPYATSGAKNALDMAFAGAAFELHVTLVFDGDGVWQLQREQLPPTGEKSLSVNLEALPIFEVKDLRVTAWALADRDLSPSDLLLPVQVLTTNSLADLLASADLVLSY